MKKIILLLLGAVSIVSCDFEDEIITGPASNTPIVSFASGVTNFGVEINSTGFSESLEIPMDISNSSNVDRTFNVTIIDAESTADATNYQLDGTFTIPANSYNGTLTILGQDTNLETDPTTIVVEIEDGGAAYTAGANGTINIFQVCPVDNTFFTGDYQMTHLAFNGFGVPTFGFGKIVTLSNDAGNTERSFVAPYAPDLGAFSDVTWSFVLSCNEIAWNLNQDSNVGCGGAAPNIELTAADAAFGNGTYDPADDASFTMNLVDDNLDDCGARTNVSILMTKQ